MLVKEWRIAMCFRQVVVWYGRAQVMYVVETYIAREPLKRQGQAIVSTAFDRREHIIPIIFSILIDILILMLYVEKPQRIGAKEK